MIQDDVSLIKPPSRPRWSSSEFLVKKTDSNSWLTDVAKGAALDVSQVMGGGFPIANEIVGLKYNFLSRPERPPFHAWERHLPHLQRH